MQPIKKTDIHEMWMDLEQDTRNCMTEQKP